MNKKPHTNRAIKLIIILVCVALVGAVVWAIVSGVTKLMHYSENTTIESEIPQSSVNEQTAVIEEPEDPLPPNLYYADGFYEVDGIRSYHGGDFIGVPGIDVSEHQTDIDWMAVKEAGIEFAMIRVGFRGWQSGELKMDKRFYDHMEGAIDAGLDVGIYFFSQALTPEEAIEEAEYVLREIEPYDITYPVVFDWEEVHDQKHFPRTKDMNMLMLTSCAEAFCKTIEDAGYRAGVYFNQSYGYGQLNLGSLLDYDFWLAEYADTPSFTHDFQMWQYTDRGTVPGIKGNVDLNIAFKHKN